jgi:hypothetical protein
VLREIEQIEPGLIHIQQADFLRPVITLTAAGRARLSAETRPAGRTLSDSERQARSQANLVQRGGKRVCINLMPSTMAYLSAIRERRPDDTTSALVAEAIECLAIKAQKTAREKK